MKTPTYTYEFLYRYVEAHAIAHNLKNTLIALPMMQQYVSDQTIPETACQHSLLVCRMMVDLNMHLSSYEEDCLLAAALCHILPEEHVCEQLDDLLVEKHHIDPEICNIIQLLYQKETAPEEKLPAYYEQIQKNKLALLITISDRGNMVEQLHDMNTWQVRRFIYETRTYYIPMCIYAKEHYHELLSPIGILAEKMRNLTDVSEILMVRFESRETELCHEILALREENATIKGIIQNLLL